MISPVQLVKFMGNRLGSDVSTKALPKVQPSMSFRPQPQVLVMKCTSSMVSFPHSLTFITRNLHFLASLIFWENHLWRIFKIAMVDDGQRFCGSFPYTFPVFTIPCRNEKNKKRRKFGLGGCCFSQVHRLPDCQFCAFFAEYDIFLSGDLEQLKFSLTTSGRKDVGISSSENGGYPQRAKDGKNVMENPTQIDDDWGDPPFQETPIFPPANQNDYMMSPPKCETCHAPR